jgi:hypothetical protein
MRDWMNFHVTDRLSIWTSKVDAVMSQARKSAMAMSAIDDGNCYIIDLKIPSRLHSMPYMLPPSRHYPLQPVIGRFLSLPLTRPDF